MIIEYNLAKKKTTRIVGVDFGVIDNDEVERLSVVEVDDINIYHRGVPMRNGINDTRMGTVDRRIKCSTCGNDVEKCSGHIGHMKLAIPFYNIGFFDTTMKILRSVCFACSRVTLTDSDRSIIIAEESNRQRFINCYNLARTKRKCNFCGLPKCNYTRQTLSLKIEWPSNAAFESDEEAEYCKRTFTSYTAYSIFDAISDEDSKILGFYPKFSPAKYDDPEHDCSSSYLKTSDHGI